MKLKECFFLPLGVLLDALNNLLRFSTVSFSRGGLPVFCGSEFGASGSVLPAPPSLPELSPRHSLPPLLSIFGVFFNERNFFFNFDKKVEVLLIYKNKKELKK